MSSSTLLGSNSSLLVIKHLAVLAFPEIKDPNQKNTSQQINITKLGTEVEHHSSNTIRLEQDTTTSLKDTLEGAEKARRQSLPTVISKHST